MQPPTKRTRQEKTQFGDFQTPPRLAAKVCELAKQLLPAPDCIIEPTCGVGNLLAQAQRSFQGASSLIGVELNREYIQKARAALVQQRPPTQTLQLIHQSCFSIDWQKLTDSQAGEILVLGNPPWVNNSTLGRIASKNLPRKSKQADLRGIDAITGKSNFDLSEWICLELIRSLPAGRSSFALLVKTAVARKVLKSAWAAGDTLSQPQIHEIDAKREFGVSVDACLFIGRICPSDHQTCPVFEQMGKSTASQVLGYDPPTLIADIAKHAKTRHLQAAKGGTTNWRSGVKHDCAKALELRIEGQALINGFDEEVNVEPEFVFPLKKSSDVASGKGNTSRRLIITQRSTGESPLTLQRRAPRLWAYLQQHAALFAARKSSIYRGRPPFSIFGVGDYSFAPYKIAISGLYKKLNFQHQALIDNKPVLFDDTVYLLPFDNEQDSKAAHALLCSMAAQDFFNARIFWDTKRPITATVLRSLDLERIGDAERTIALASFGPCCSGPGDTHKRRY